MAIHGRNIIVSMASNGDVIAGTRSNDIESNAEAIEISSPSQGAWRQFIAGRKEWQVTTNFLMMAASGLIGLLNVGNTYTLTIKDSTPTISLSGTAELVTCKITATIGNIVQGTFVFRGSGALSETSFNNYNQESDEQ